MVGEQNPFFLFTVFQPRTIHAPFQHWLQILVLKKNRRLHKRRDVIFFLPFNSFFVVYILDYQNDFVILLAFFSATLWHYSCFFPLHFQTIWNFIVQNAEYVHDVWWEKLMRNIGSVPQCCVLFVWVGFFFFRAPSWICLTLKSYSLISLYSI